MSCGLREGGRERERKREREREREKTSGIRTCGMNNLEIY